jgi:hypothetical protein
MVFPVLEAIVSGTVAVILGSVIYYVGVIVRTLNRIDRTRVKREGIAIEDGIRKENEAQYDKESTPPCGDTKR